jgi:hypothetical protein
MGMDQPISARRMGLVPQDSFLQRSLARPDCSLATARQE